MKIYKSYPFIEKKKDETYFKKPLDVYENLDLSDKEVVNEYLLIRLTLTVDEQDMAGMICDAARENEIKIDDIDERTAKYYLAVDLSNDILSCQCLMTVNLLNCEDTISGYFDIDLSNTEEKELQMELIRTLSNNWIKTKG